MKLLDSALLLHEVASGGKRHPLCRRITSLQLSEEENIVVVELENAADSVGLDLPPAAKINTRWHKLHLLLPPPGQGRDDACDHYHQQAPPEPEGFQDRYDRMPRCTQFSFVRDAKVVSYYWL